jgi:perosamine synthetase
MIIPHSRPWITKEDIDLVNEVINSEMIAQGQLVKEFEKLVGDYLQLQPGIAAVSGTAALVLALQAINTGKGSEIILPTYVCNSVLDAIISVGATPVVCDIGSNWVMTEKEVGHLVSEKTVAIIAVHIFGISVDIESLRQFEVPIIEDSCQSFGGDVNDIPSGTTGDIGVFSFNATKCLTTGEGGMLVSKNSIIIENIRNIQKKGPKSTSCFLNKMSDLQASLGISQIKRYEQFIVRRNILKNNYLTELKDISSLEFSPYKGCLFRFPIKTNLPFNDLQSKMLKRRVSIRRGVDQLLHRELGLSDAKYPNAVNTFNKTISIPFYPALSEVECDEVIDVVRALC